MSLHRDLLDQAQHLARREPKRPKQASLRRAVSTAYYALFHLLAEDGARLVTPATLRPRVRRAFVHGQMSKVCRQFAKANPAALSPATRVLVNPPIEPELVSVAKAFVDLQDERHRADYDISTPFVRVEVIQKIDGVTQAFTDWGKVRKNTNTQAFLAALLFHDRWNR